MSLEQNLVEYWDCAFSSLVPPGKLSQNKALYFITTQKLLSIYPIAVDIIITKIVWASHITVCTIDFGKAKHD